MKQVLVLNGPNINLLGLREPSIYGTDTLNSLEIMLSKQAEMSGIKLIMAQSNSEGVLIDSIHQAAKDNISYIIFNPAAFTHTSVALRDAMLAVSIPFIEVHISNIYAREPFRAKSYFSDIAEGVITGLGIKVYSLALQTIIEQFN